MEHCREDLKVSPNNLKVMTLFLLFFAGSRKPDSDGSPATSSASLYLTSHHTLHEMTHSITHFNADAEPAVN